MDANNTTPTHQAPVSRQEPSSFAYHPYVPGPFRPSGHFQPLRPPPAVPYSTGMYNRLPAHDENIDPSLRNLATRPQVRPFSPSGQTARPVLGVLPNHTLPYPPPLPPPPHLIHPQPISVQALLSHSAWRNGSFLGLPPKRPPPPPALIPPPAALAKKEEQAELFASLLVPGVLPKLLVTHPSEPSAVGRFQGMDLAERERLEEALRQLACASSPPLRTPPHPPAADTDASVHGEAAAAAASLDAELSALNTQLSKPATPEPVPEPALPQAATQLREQASSVTEPMQIDGPLIHSSEDVEMARLLLGLMTATPTTPATAVAAGSRRSTPDEPEEDESVLLPPLKRRATAKNAKAPVKPRTTPAKGRAKAAPKAKRAPARGKGKAGVASPPIPTEEEETPMPKPKHTYSRHKKVAANAPNPSEHKRTVTFAKEDAVRHFEGSSPVSGNSPPPPSGSSSPLSPPDALPSAFRRIVRTKPEAHKDGVAQGTERPPTPKRARVTRATTARSKALAAKAKAKVVESEKSAESEDVLDLIVVEDPVPASCGTGSANQSKKQEVSRSEERWFEATSVWAAAHKMPTTSRMRSTLRPENMSSDAVDESDESGGEKTSVTPPTAGANATAPAAKESSAVSKSPGRQAELIQETTVANDRPRQTAIPKQKEHRWRVSRYQQS